MPELRRFARLAALLLTILGAGCNRQDVASPQPPRPPRPPRPAAVPATKPVPAVDRAIVISIDGLRPDLIFRSGALHLSDLLDAGSFSLWAKAASLPYTLPSHTSMLTGVSPERHEVTSNSFTAGPDGYPVFPTLFEVARAGKLTTAFVAGKAKMAVLARPGSVDWPSVREADCDAVAEDAVRVLLDHKPNLLVVHFKECDVAGHASGWGSPQQLDAVRRIDAALSRLLAAVTDAKLADSTFLIVTADHGGGAHTHGPDARGSTIPWIARGPGVRRGYDLDRARDVPVRTEDTFATVALALGLPLPPDLDGRPVTEIFPGPADEELLRDAR